MRHDPATGEMAGNAIDRASSAATAIWRRVRRVPTAFIFVGSLALALLLLWRQGSLGSLGETARNAEPFVIGAAFVLSLLSVVLLCLRWQALVQMAGGRYDPTRAAEALLTSVVVNYAAPKGLAVPTRAILSARDLGLTPTASGAVALWDVALDFVALGAMSLIWFALSDRGLLQRLERPTLGLSVVAAGLIALATVIMVIVARRRPDLRARAQAAVREMVSYPGRRPIAALTAAALTAAYWASQTIVFRLMLDAVGLGAEATWVAVLGFLGLPVLIGMFSPTPGGTGVREALMVVVAQAAGMPGAPVLVAAVAYRVALLVAVPVLYLPVRLWRRWREGSVVVRSSTGHD